MFFKHVFGKLVPIFGKLVHIFGKLAHIFRKLVHIFAQKLVSRTSKQFSKNLGPLWQPGVYNDTNSFWSSRNPPLALQTGWHRCRKGVAAASGRLQHCKGACREGWAPEPVRVSLKPVFVAENPLVFVCFPRKLAGHLKLKAAHRPPYRFAYTPSCRWRTSGHISLVTPRSEARPALAPAPWVRGNASGQCLNPLSVSKLPAS